MNGMNTSEMSTASTPPEILADLAVVLQHVVAGTPVDPVLGRRVQERSERLTEALRQRYGELEMAVDLIREIRDEE